MTHCRRRHTAQQTYRGILFIQRRFECVCFGQKFKFRPVCAVYPCSCRCVCECTKQATREREMVYSDAFVERELPAYDARSAVIHPTGFALSFVTCLLHSASIKENGCKRTNTRSDRQRPVIRASQHSNGPLIKFGENGVGITSFRCVLTVR